MEPATTATSITVVEHTNFAVSDQLGDMLPGGYHGFFSADTRFLSRLVVRLGGRRLEPLSAASARHHTASFYLANPALRTVRAATIAVFRDRRIDERLEERIRLISYAMQPLELELSVEVDADFADIFEVRGRQRMRRVVHADTTPRRVVLSYEHRGYTRTTTVSFSRPVTSIGDRHAITASLERGRPWDLDIVVTPRRSRAHGVPPLPAERRIAPDLVHRWQRRLPRLRSADGRVERAWEQAGRDLASLLLTGPAGNFLPAAGLPWYLAVFGRDSCITALQTMVLGADIPHGTLRQLSLYQGSDVDHWREEEPGKIPHEVRTGELATLAEVPFSRYYGSVDATPLFVMLFAAACRWSGWLPRAAATGATSPTVPKPLAEFLPAVERALRWIDSRTDADGLLWYDPRHRRGIVNQAWKDSADSMRYRDGRIAGPPIAAVEVQGYVIAARRGMAQVYAALGRGDDAARQAAAADRLAANVEQALWMPDEGTYALGLDPDRRQIDAVASNAGHLLWCGVPGADRAAAVAERLMARDMFSGWGIRTLSSGNPAYNPLGYHIGSVWPHDTSLIAAGLAAYRHEDSAWRLIDALLDAADADPQSRLSELFAGFDRASTADLVPYPTACEPQAWATGAIVLGVQTMLGLEPMAGEPSLRPLRGAPPMRLSGVRIGLWSGNLSTDR